MVHYGNACRPRPGISASLLLQCVGGTRYAVHVFIAAASGRHAYSVRLSVHAHTQRPVFPVAASGFSRSLLANSLTRAEGLNLSFPEVILAVGAIFRLPSVHLTLRLLNTETRTKGRRRRRIWRPLAKVPYALTSRASLAVWLNICARAHTAMRVIGSAKEAIKRAEDAVFCIGDRARTGYCCGAREGMPPDYGRWPGVRFSFSTLRYCRGACIGSRDLALRGQRFRGPSWCSLARGSLLCTR